jgi:hypothetical protein
MVNEDTPSPERVKPTRTLLEIITAAFVASGQRGPLTREFIDRWRAEHPAYGRWPLCCRFHSGSPVALRGKTKLDRATAAWLEDGNPRPGSSEFPQAEFMRFVDEFCDEFCEEFYAA